MRLVDHLRLQGCHHTEAVINVINTKGFPGRKKPVAASRAMKELWAMRQRRAPVAESDLLFPYGSSTLAQGSPAYLRSGSGKVRTMLNRLAFLVGAPKGLYSFHGLASGALEQLATESAIKGQNKHANAVQLSQDRLRWEHDSHTMVEIYDQNRAGLFVAKIAEEAGEDMEKQLECLGRFKHSDYHPDVAFRQHIFARPPSYHDPHDKRKLYDFLTAAAVPCVQLDSEDDETDSEYQEDYGDDDEEESDEEEELFEVEDIVGHREAKDVSICARQSRMSTSELSLCSLRAQGWSWKYAGLGTTRAMTHSSQWDGSRICK